VRIVKIRSGVTSSTEVQIRNLRDKTATLSAWLVGRDGIPRVAFRRDYSSDPSNPELVSFEIPRADLQSAQKSSLLITVKAGSDTLYESGLISLNSSHRTNGENRSAVSSTSHAAEVEIAKAVPLKRKADSGEVEAAPEQSVVGESLETVAADAGHVNDKPVNSDERARREQHPVLAESVGGASAALSNVGGSAMLAQPVGSEPPLTNERIVHLLSAGVTPDELVRIIGTAPQVSFNLTPTGTDALLKAGVADDIIKAMAAREQGIPIKSSR
jgi:hypothetical protein